MALRPSTILAFLAVTAALGQASLAASLAGKTGAPGTNVDMPFLIAPMSNDGKLLGYAYISSKLVTSSLSAAIAVRDKLAFIQDAYVRDVNAQPIAKAGDPTMVDTGLLAARLTADAKRIVGNAKVVGVVFSQIQFAPLHPTDTTLNVAAPNQVASGTAAQPAQPAASATTEPAKDSKH